MEKLIVRQSPTGWSVTWFKPKGTNKGETVLGTFCGGMLGKTLALECLTTASNITMCTDIELDF